MYNLISRNYAIFVYAQIIDIPLTVSGSFEGPYSGKILNWSIKFTIFVTLLKERYQVLFIMSAGISTLIFLLVFMCYATHQCPHP